MKLFARIAFAFRHRTLRPIAVSPDGKQVLICHEGRDVALPRRCPHQGAPMEKGHIENGRLVCPWHGCAFELENRRFCPSRFTPGA